MGSVQTSVNELLERSTSGEPLNLVDPRKPGKDVGHLLVRSMRVEPQPSFLDYITGGCEISFSVAIDFTGSNRPPTDPSSLHYLDRSGRPNQYQAAIQAVGQVLEYYDSDKIFPAFGFGGVPRGSPSTLHSFPLYDSHGSAELHGIAGVMEAYNLAISTTALSGPTLFTQIIGEASARAMSMDVGQRNQQYQVLLILTDGIVNDLDSTIRSIVHAADLPMSILIVGVGDADFSAMEALDGDKHRLSYGGRTASRDIVQFVSLMEQTRGKSHVEGVEAMSRELLAEIPGQLLSYFMSRNITPNPRPNPAYGAVGGLSHADVGVSLGTAGAGAGRAAAVPPPPTAPSAPASAAV